MNSPPKRMTRARAAARASADTTKPTRIVTAASRVRSLSTATASTKSTSAKRKARDDERSDFDEDMAGSNTRRAVRARPGNRDETAVCGTTSVESVSRESRSRSTRKATVVVPDNGQALTVTRARGRVRKPTSQDRTNPTPIAPRADKKTTQTRIADSIVSKPALDVSKSISRKTTTSQRPGKENVNHGMKAAETSSNVVVRGLRGRPTRRAAVPVQPSEKSRKKPLSPKKVTQMPFSRDKESSDAEISDGDGVSMTAKSPKRVTTDEFSKDKKAEDMYTDHEEEQLSGAAKCNAGPGTAAFGSPARRAPQSPPRETLKSPAKRVGGLQLPGLHMHTRVTSTVEQDTQTLPDLSNVLLQSPAKRPPSPIKGLNFPSRSFGSTINQDTSIKSCPMLQSPAKRAMPGASSLMQHPARASAPLSESQEMQSIMAANLPGPSSGRPSDLLLAEDLDDSMQNSTADYPFDEPIQSPCFSARMLAMLPNQTDLQVVVQAADELSEYTQPVWTSNATSPGTENCGALSGITLREDSSIHQDQPRLETAGISQEAGNEDFMNLQDKITDMEEPEENPFLTDKSEAATNKSQYESNFKIQDGIVDSCCNSKSDIESKDDVCREMTESVLHDRKGQRTSYLDGSIYATRRLSRRSNAGLQPSTEQSGSCSATTTIQSETSTSSVAKDINSIFSKDDSHDPLKAFRTDTSPTRSTFFEDEIMVHADFLSSEKQSMSIQPVEYESDGANSMEDVDMFDEDVALTQDANVVSPMLRQKSEEVVENCVCEETLSEASQEYGDENEVPVEPPRIPQMATPARLFPQTAFFTTTKVPLKPADDSESSPLKKRSFSAGRTSFRNAGSLSKNATAVSWSPTKDRRRASIHPGDMFTTPIKGDQQSSAETPGTPARRDVDPVLLRGCVVLVDVHTTEGADASGIFVELLTHMGAKCVKTWHWNPSGSGNGDSSSSKVGITHVVFKDGGKRTMEKVREAGGAVHCVGVSWVLDCERENEWLDEAPYYLDTSVIPRGGARRRKSMEPKAITNLNGTIVSGDNKLFEPISTPKNRRESTLWMRTPPEKCEEEDDEELEWSCALLTPVPKTPAPEAVAKYASELPVTPSSEEDSDLQSPTKQSLLTRTCPPKEGKYHDLSHGILSRDKDEQVVMRLMAARRKSLQFAPKIGSPLARTWN
ncbi:hypothetical protein E4U21_007141 [Claviceps maximensis]|nr:hypothetical protein E4U21_007141 [Claviceps maximensis]